jgi:hypothetical protein
MNRSELKKLETIIEKLEKWQARNGQHDQSGLARAAKEKLMSLLRELESKG